MWIAGKGASSRAAGSLRDLLRGSFGLYYPCYRSSSRLKRNEGLRFSQRCPVALVHRVPLSSTAGLVSGCSPEEQAALQGGSPPLWWSRWPLGPGEHFKRFRRAPKGRVFEEQTSQMAMLWSRADQAPWWVLPLEGDLWCEKVTPRTF